MVLLDNRRLKFISLCAFMHNEILGIEEAEREHRGEKIMEDEDDFVRNTILSIKSIIEAKHYTKKDLVIVHLRFPQVKVYFDTISHTITKHIKAGQEWIPSLIILSVLQEYTQRGYEEFNHIPFTEAIDKFILCKKANASKYLRVAWDVYDTLVNLQYKKVKKNRIKR